jgi:acyl dehydratase
VDKYLTAVDGSRSIYEKNNIVPPMSIAALAMAAMAEGLSMPPGAIHVSQEIKFLKQVRTSENLTSYARVNRIVKRGKLHMLSIGINVVNENNISVLEGETSFILPVSQ